MLHIWLERGHLCNTLKAESSGQGNFNSLAYDCYSNVVHNFIQTFDKVILNIVYNESLDDGVWWCCENQCSMYTGQFSCLKDGGGGKGALKIIKGICI